MCGQGIDRRIACRTNRDSVKLRSVLQEVADGIASAAEGDLRALVKPAGLPEPIFNPELYVGSEFLGKPDAYWRDAEVAGEVDSSPRAEPQADARSPGRTWGSDRRSRRPTLRRSARGRGRNEH